MRSMNNKKIFFFLLKIIFCFFLKNFLPCLTSPCLNNGTCSASSSGTVQCNCTSCYSGPLCQTTNYCCLNVCSPNGVCISGLDSSYLCICQPNYVGTNCSVFNPCALLPCLNNGKIIKRNFVLFIYFF
jgi:Notch-like protein